MFCDTAIPIGVPFAHSLVCVTSVVLWTSSRLLDVPCGTLMFSSLLLSSVNLLSLEFQVPLGPFSAFALVLPFRLPLPNFCTRLEVSSIEPLSIGDSDFSLGAFSRCSRSSLLRISFMLWIVVDTPEPFLISERKLLKPSSSGPLLLSFPPLRKYPFLLADLGCHPADSGLVEEPMSLDREKKLMKSGRKVAIEEAVMPMPGSTVDPTCAHSVHSYNDSDCTHR